MDFLKEIERLRKVNERYQKALEEIANLGIMTEDGPDIAQQALEEADVEVGG